ASAADVTTALAHELRRVETLADQRLVEIDDEVSAPVVHRTDDHARRLLLPAQTVGEVTELSAFCSLRLDEHDIALALDDREVGRRGRLRLARLFARRLELAPQLLRLLPGTVKVRVGLARGDGLDPPRARADRALRENHERADLGRPAHVRAATELARVARDLDHANLVAVLLPEEHHRAELARFLDRRHE